MSKAKTAALSSSENNSQRQPLYIWPSLLGKRLRFGSTVWTMALGLASFTMVSKTSAFDKISNATASVTHSLGSLFEDGPENPKLASAVPAITAAYRMDTLRYGDNEKLDEVIDTSTTAEGFMHGMTAVLGEPLSAKEVFEKRKANESDYQKFVTDAYQARLGKATPDTLVKFEMDVSPIRGKDFDSLEINSPFGHRTGVEGGSANHKGVDFKAKAGTPLQAPVSGVIKEISKSRKSGGKVVILGDNGSEHTFYHVKHLLTPKEKGKKQRWALKKGQRIEAAEQFGTVGQGSDAGTYFSWKKMKYVNYPPHCHWEIRKNLPKGKAVLLNAEEVIYTNGLATLVEEPKNKKDQLPAHTLRMMQMDEEGLWVSQLPETIQELKLSTHYTSPKYKDKAARTQKEAVDAAKKVVKEVLKNADSALMKQVVNDRKDALASAFGKDAASDIAVNEAPKKEEKVDNSAALAASKAKGDVNKKAEVTVSEIDPLDFDYSDREVYGPDRLVPRDSMNLWISQDPEWQRFAAQVNRPMKDVVDAFVKVSGGESGFDPTVKAKRKTYVDKNGKLKEVKRTASSSFGLIKETREGAADQLGLKFPEEKDWGTVKGLKTQIRIAGRVARNKRSDLLQADEAYQARTGESALNRVYKDALTGELKYESELSAVVNCWGPGVGGYMELRGKEIAQAKEKGELPVHNNALYASHQFQDFNKYKWFVKSTKAEKKIEQKVAEEMKQLKAVSYRYSENKNSLDIQEHGSMSVDAAGKLNFYLKNTDMSKIAFADERRKTAPALALT